MYRVTKEFQYSNRSDFVCEVETYEEASVNIIKDYPDEIFYIRSWGNVDKNGEYKDLGSHAFLYKIIKC